MAHMGAADSRNPRKERESITGGSLIDTYHTPSGA